MEKRIAEWRRNAERYETEPGEGRREVTANALQATREREGARRHVRRRNGAVASVHRARVGGHHYRTMALTIFAGRPGLIASAVVMAANFAPGLVTQLF
jgi:hypothetical protein